MSNPNVTATSGDQFHFDRVYPITVTVPYTDYVIYSHDYGEQLDFDLNASGRTDYTYQFPYNVNFEFPDKVYPGERVVLRPVFDWTLVQVKATQQVAYSFASYAWLDAPFDGLDAASIQYTQRPSDADLHLHFPVFPLIPSVPLDIDNITVPPFNSGGGDFGGISVKLGGTGSLADSGWTNAQGTGPEIWAISEPDSISAWGMQAEIFQLTANILSFIPSGVTQAVAVCLEAVRWAGDFRLNVNLQGNIKKWDYAVVIPSDLDVYVDVPASVQPGGVWEFTDLPVTVKYAVRTGTSIWYPMDFLVTFDMRMIDEDTLVNQPLYDFYAGVTWSDWKDTTGTFLISGRVPVTTRAGVLPQPQVVPHLTLPGPAAHRATLVPPTPPGIRLAHPRALQRVIHRNVTVHFPEPTAKQGQPQAGHQTVILGRAPNSTAATIVAASRRYGIEAFLVTVPHSSDKVITFGSFANARDATLFSNMLKEIFQVESAVAPQIIVQKVPTIGNDVLSKLRSRSH